MGAETVARLEDPAAFAEMLSNMLTVVDYTCLHYVFEFICVSALRFAFSYDAAV